MSDSTPMPPMRDQMQFEGSIKDRPEDFLVYEIPMYESCGEGEHLYVRIRKSGVSHDELISIVAAAWSVPVRAIGFAGIKDTRAVTEQTLSIHLPDSDRAPTIDDDRLEVLWTDRHRNKLRRGHLAGNRFVIRVRGIDPLRVTDTWSRLRVLADRGVPNAFGPQRFGRAGDNHLLGRLLLREDWSALAARLGDGRPGRLESRVRRAVEEGTDPERACRAVPGRLRRFWNDALQSALFNAVLSERVTRGDWNRLRAGDVAWNHETRRTFVVGDEDLQDDETMERIERGVLVPTGPMWGRAMRSPGEPVAALERGVADALDPELVPLLVDSGRSRGDRRPLVVPLAHASVQSEMDEHSGCITVQFELPPGAYATTVLRELFGDSTVATGLEEV
ncbi:MAG: tRNA pseudouridine(13) synthase TruD [Planctomycetota bacterium]|nr:tRNA pseudouridine(13) synthase TruD [Planctomycetota bacterium]